MIEKEEKRDKRQLTFIIVILLLIFGFVAVGVTFAYFSISVRGNENASKIVVKTAKIGEVVFTDGNEIVISEAYPNMFASRTFTVSYAGDDELSETSIGYQVHLVQSSNEFAAKGISEFVHWISDDPSKTFVNGEDKGSITSNIGTSKETAYTVGPVGTTIVIAEGTLYPGSVHTITYLVGLKENDANQNEAQNTKFNARLYVTVDGSGGLTTDDEGNIINWSSASTME